MKIAFVGGTGPAGIGIAARMAAAGHHIVVGSRKQERAEAVRDKVLELVPSAQIDAKLNPEAVADGEVVFITVPPDAQRPTVEGLKAELAGKIAVSVASPIRIEDKKVFFDEPAAGSLAQDMAEAAPDAKVVGALHEIHVKKFADLSKEILSDTIVTGDDDEAKQVVMKLCEQIASVRAIDGGGLDNTRWIEGMVAVLVGINFRYKAKSSFKLTGIKLPG